MSLDGAMNKRSQRACYRQQTIDQRVVCRAIVKSISMEGTLFSSCTRRDHSTLFTTSYVYSTFVPGKMREASYHPSPCRVLEFLSKIPSLHSIVFSVSAATLSIAAQTTLPSSLLDGPSLLDGSWLLDDSVDFQSNRVTLSQMYAYVCSLYSSRRGLILMQVLRAAGTSTSVRCSSPLRR